MTRSAAAVAIAALLVMDSPASILAADPDAVARHLSEAHAAVARGDANAALRAFTAAVREDPSSAVARLQRGEFLLAAIPAARDRESRHNMEQMAAGDFRTVIQADGESVWAAMARDRLAMLSGRVVLPVTPVTCDSRADAQSRTGYSHLRAGRHTEAAVAYQKATDACPADPSLWTLYGNTMFVAGDLDRAEDLFKQALRLDPWHREAHRFYTTVWERRGQTARAYEQAVLAVVADPTYELAWHALKEQTLRLAGQWRRVRNYRPSVTRGDDGKPNIVLPAELGKTVEKRWTIWVGMGFTEASLLADGAAPSSEIERARRVVETAVRFTRHLSTKEPEARSPEFLALEAAMDAGFLDEAIFIGLLDARLAADYVRYRNQQSERLVDYVKRFVAPLPGGDPLRH
jgi:tetratricopeptide (TPR) repeat protein